MSAAASSDNRDSALDDIRDAALPDIRDAALPDIRASALADIRAVELATGIAGPFCGKMFADFGADVLKIEPPDGDPSRAMGPFPGGVPDPNASGMFRYLNANKRGAALDVSDERDRARIAELCASADVVVESFAPGFMESVGLGYGALRSANPRIVLVSATPFGQSGPWRDRPATDLTLYAASGLSFVNGSPDREPLKEPGPESGYQAGATAFIGAMAALAALDFDGRGQWVDVSALESAASNFAPQFLGATHSGEPVPRGSAPLLPCKDGWVSLNVRHDATWEYMWLFFGEPELARDSRYATAAARRERAAEIEALLLPRLAEYTMEQLFLGLAPLRLLVGMAMTVEGLLADAHLRERGFFHRDDAVGADAPGAPFRMSETPWAIRRAPPTLGENGAEGWGR